MTEPSEVRDESETPLTIPRPSRNVVHEMRIIIDRFAVGTYYPALIANKVVAHLRQHDPELLDEWLSRQAETFVRQAISSRDRSMRAAAKQSLVKSVFMEDARAFEEGDRDRLAGWMHAPLTLSDGTRIPMADMTKEQLLDVAGQYRKRATSQMTMAVFLTAVANKMGAGTVEQEVTEVQLDEMWEALSGTPS